MKLESIKSVILVILVVISLILTVRLWNFSPELNQIEDPTPRQTSINGEKLTVKDVILPTNITFHKHDNVYELAMRESETTLYKEMQQWALQQFGPVINRGENYSIPKSHVEITFPTEIPLSILPNLFKVSENEILPEFSFDKISFIPDTESQSSIKVTFSSSKHFLTINADIYAQETNPYKSLMAYLEDNEALAELIPFEIKNGNTVYLPKEGPSFNKQTYMVNEISDWPLLNYLFQDPNAVKNIGFYTDGDRKLEILYYNSDKKYMSYENPITSDNNVLNRADLISRSLAYVNNQDGWTDSFMLTDIENDNKTINFQLLVNGIPILTPLGKMELDWESEGLTGYERPLIELSTHFPFDDYGEQNVILTSGEALLTYFNSEQFKYKPQQIEDIQIGYSVVNEENNNILSLEPNWFVKINGIWRSITPEESPEQGGV